MPKPGVHLRQQARHLLSMFDPDPNYPENQSYAGYLSGVYREHIANIDGIFPLPDGAPSPDQLDLALKQLQTSALSLTNAPNAELLAEGQFSALRNTGGSTGNLVTEPHLHFTDCPLQQLGPVGIFKRALAVLQNFQSLNITDRTEALIQQQGISIDEAFDLQIEENPVFAVTVDGTAYAMGMNSLMDSLNQLANPAPGRRSHRQ